MRALGIDIGTTTISVLVLNAESGDVIHSGCVANQFILGKQYERLQDPEHIWSLACELIDGLSAQYGPFKSIGVTGQMHGILYVNAAGTAVSPLYTWQDASANEPMEDGVPFVQQLARQSGYKMASGFGLATLYVHVQRGQIPEKAAAICTIGDYIAMRLVSQTSPAITPSNAASIGLFRLDENKFDVRALIESSLPQRLLPSVTDCFTPLGTTSKGEVVAPAVGDNQASVLGSVRDLEDTVLLNVGTGSQISLAVPAGSQALEDGIERRPCLPGMDILVGAPLCGGRAYALLHDFFKKTAEIAGISIEGTLYAQMETAASSMDEPVQILPLFCGTRQNPQERAVISNIGADNFTPAALIKGMLIGMADELYGLYGKMLSVRNSPPTLLVGSGNGIRKNASLVRKMESIFSLPLRVPAHEEEAAFGAALCGLVCAGVFPSMRHAQTLIRYRD